MQLAGSRPQSHAHGRRESRSRSTVDGSTHLTVYVTKREHDGRRVRRASVVRWFRQGSADISTNDPPRVVTSRLGDRIEQWAVEQGLRDEVTQVDVETHEKCLAVAVRLTPNALQRLMLDSTLMEDLLITEREPVVA